jgi:hypothetical protein
MLQSLGKHKLSGGGCLYINKLVDVDLEVLAEIIGKAYHHTAPSSASIMNK